MRDATTTNRVARAKIYRNAAKLIANKGRKYSCCAIDEAAGYHVSTSPESVPYRAMMSRDDGAFQTAIYEAAAEIAGPDSYSHPVYGTDGPWCRDLRILLLCFYAAMVEAGDA